ncbi:MAG: helix-turn-helix domain-containing protein [Flavobacterium sp.]
MKINVHKLKKTRLDKGFSQEYISEQLNISQSHYSKLENGEVNFKFEQFSKLIEVLDTNPMDFIDFNQREQIFINSSYSGNNNSNINISVDDLRKLINEEISKMK